MVGCLGHYSYKDKLMVITSINSVLSKKLVCGFTTFLFVFFNSIRSLKFDGDCILKLQAVGVEIIAFLVVYH